MTTLVAAWTAARRALEAAGVDTPVFDARLLIEAGAGVNRLDILTDPHRALDAVQIEAIDAQVTRRAAREPVSQILGRKEFRSLSFVVTPDVLTPRPETEFLVEAGLAMLDPQAPARVLDLGVGSGAALLSVLMERPNAVGVGVDKSAAALAVARENAAALGLSARAALVEGDWAEGLDGPFDLVVSNPPYVRTGALGLLAPEVSKFEPALALDGGPDGLAAYRAIMPAIRRVLRPGGGWAVEVGEGQAEAVWAHADAAGLAPQDVVNDFSGIARIVHGRSPA
ncbi:MAG: peptide chain release factor N(5)-glutamine methyltransferase [Alphaproteobacteria bacterium]|nr:peptide chain release factor N(5)-glutamine methyltransferase [Alphaproteobacteria bacterium]